MIPIYGVDMGRFLQLWTTDGGEVGSQVEKIQSPPFLQQVLDGLEDRVPGREIRGSDALGITHQGEKAGDQGF